MEKNTYKLISRFECCGKAMVTVIMYGKAACVMHEIEFNRMIETNGLVLKELHFGCDGSYNAYIVDVENAEIGKHYNKIAEYDSWMKIYDDTELVKVLKADKIIVYRAAEMGCIIQLINKMEE